MGDISPELLAQRFFQEGVSSHDVEARTGVTITFPTGVLRVENAAGTGVPINRLQVIDTGGVFATPIVLTAAESGAVILLDDAAGLDFTLPSLTADTVGINYTFRVTVANTSNSYRFTAAAGDLLDGSVIMYDKDVAEGSTEALLQLFIPDKSDDLIMTVAGATTAGGLRGGEFTFTAHSATSWWVSGYLVGDGSLATVFS